MLERTSNEWDNTIDVMLLRIEARGVVHNDEEIQTISAYLNKNSKK